MSLPILPSPSVPPSIPKTAANSLNNQNPPMIITSAAAANIDNVIDADIPPSPPPSPLPPLRTLSPLPPHPT
jgi:hypothetical protein